MGNFLKKWLGQREKNIDTEKDNLCRKWGDRTNETLQVFPNLSV